MYKIELGNKKRGDTGYYIGRGTPLGNPFRIGRDGTRDEVITKYAHWLGEKIRIGDKEVMEEIEKIAHLTAAGQGITLLCYCHPERCHGEIVRHLVYRLMKDKVQFTAQFVGGEHDGQMAELNCNNFKIGMQFMLGKTTYEVCDGPAARAIEHNQSGHENLCVVCKAVEEKDAKAQLG